MRLPAIVLAASGFAYAALNGNMTTCLDAPRGTDCPAVNPSDKARLIDSHCYFASMNIDATNSRWVVGSSTPRVEFFISGEVNGNIPWDQNFRRRCVSAFQGIDQQCNSTAGGVYMAPDLVALYNFCTSSI